MVAMFNWFYTRRGTYYMLHFSILGIEAIFGWRAAEFYASLFTHLASGFALALVCIAIGLIVWIFGFALSTHYRFAIESVIELTRKRASGAISETWVKVQAYIIIGAAITLVLANDVAGAVYLSLQASLDTPQFVMALIGLCAFIALPFLVGYFLPALAASLPAEEQALVLDALLRQTWDLLRYESEHRVKKHMSGIRRGEVHAFTSFAEAIDALLSGADPGLPHVQALLKLKEAGALNFQGAAGADLPSISMTPLTALHTGPATNGAHLKDRAWSNAGSGGWTTDLTLTEVVEELAEQDDLEVTEAEVLDMQRRGKITLYKDKDGAWRMDLKNFVLLKLALGLHADVQPAVPIAPPTPEHTLHASGALYTWLTWGTPLAPLPERWVRLLAARHQRRPQRAWSADCAPATLPQRALAGAIRRARPGERNHLGYWLACRLVEAGIDQGQAENIMCRYADAVGHLGEPAYTVEEALASLQSAARITTRS